MLVTFDKIGEVHIRFLATNGCHVWVCAYNININNNNNNKKKKKKKKKKLRTNFYSAYRVKI